jgi:hypothetical protein
MSAICWKLTKARLHGLGVAIALTLPGMASAELIDRGNGLIYDDVLDITWMQDANYAQTSGYDADGRLRWLDALSWVDGLVYGGYDDWRLPDMIDLGNDGCDYGIDCGYNVDTSTGELASLFYDTLGNTALYYGDPYPPNIPTPCFYDDDVGPCLSNTGPFDNMQNYFYWTSTEYVLNTERAWYFNFIAGNQNPSYKSTPFYAWAVRSGDVAVVSVPEPGTMYLLGAGFAAVVFGRRRWQTPELHRSR